MIFDNSHLTRKVWVPRMASVPISSHISNHMQPFASQVFSHLCRAAHRPYIHITKLTTFAYRSVCAQLNVDAVHNTQIKINPSCIISVVYSWWCSSNPHVASSDVNDVYFRRNAQGITSGALALPNITYLSFSLWTFNKFVHASCVTPNALKLKNGQQPDAPNVRRDIFMENSRSQAAAAETASSI